VKEYVLQNHGPWRKVHLSFVENTGHTGFALEVTEMACALLVHLAVHGTIPVSTASS
jgi:hypothetical protein